jgi:hypothetical protein
MNNINNVPSLFVHCDSIHLSDRVHKHIFCCVCSNLWLTMHNTCLLPIHFTSLPNKVVLIIWMYLTNAETIKNFSGIKCQRYKRLLETYCYNSIDFYMTTLTTFQLCCTRLLDHYRLNVHTLKLGHRDSYSQLRLFHNNCLSKWIKKIYTERESFTYYELNFWYNWGNLLSDLSRYLFLFFSFFITSWHIPATPNARTTQCSWVWCQWSCTWFVNYFVHWKISTG